MVIKGDARRIDCVGYMGLSREKWNSFYGDSMLVIFLQPLLNTRKLTGRMQPLSPKP